MGNGLRPRRRPYRSPVTSRNWRRLDGLIRERADLADDKESYKKQVEEADSWLQKALDTKKAKQEKAEKKTAGGITNEQ